MPQSPSKASYKHLLVFSYLPERLAPIFMQYHHYMTTLANFLRDVGTLAGRLSRDNTTLRAQAGWPEEEKRAVEA
ncbi:hypothetical protein GW17_00051730 [Ensete ventricosum]|nr:hypothetical protein GW17_00051730 [Ensete ventricosum]